MRLLRTLDVSASGLGAQRRRLEVIAQNLAHTETTRAEDGGPYRRRAVRLEPAPEGSFAALLAPGAAPAGVRVAGVVETRDPARRVHQPGHPDAGPDGFVTLPNVDPLAEMVDLLATTRAYEANASAFQATKSLTQQALDLLR
jgi:flagellar basal-body rod protein FlgC